MKIVQKFREVVAILLALTILSACSAKTQTVEWYKAHEAERKKMLTECSNNPGERQSDPNCINAKKAAQELFNSIPKAGSPGKSYSY